MFPEPHTEKQRSAVNIWNGFIGDGNHGSRPGSGPPFRSGHIGLPGGTPQQERVRTEDVPIMDAVDCGGGGVGGEQGD